MPQKRNVAAGMPKIKKDHLKPLSSYSWDGNTHESIILHTTLGNTYRGAFDTLKIRGLSYHYIVDTDGTIRELVPIDRSAWHAGVKSNPNARVRSFYGNDNPNRRSIGISVVRRGQPSLEPEQRDAVVWLIKNIGHRTGVRYNADNIFTHHEITDYKPKEVNNYRQQVLDGLVGFKDEKDVVQKKKLLVSLLEQLIDALIKLQKARMLQ